MPNDKGKGIVLEKGETDRSIEQIRKSSNRPTPYGWLIFENMQRQLNGDRIVFLTNCARIY